MLHRHFFEKFQRAIVLLAVDNQLPVLIRVLQVIRIALNRQLQVVQRGFGVVGGHGLQACLVVGIGGA